MLETNCPTTSWHLLTTPKAKRSSTASCIAASSAPVIKRFEGSVDWVGVEEKGIL